MIIFDEDRPSESPFVERVWRCHSEGAGPFLSIAQSRCELVVTKLRGKVILTVRGPETKAAPLGVCPGDGEWLGIRLKPDAFLLHLPARTLVDATVTLPEARSNSFWLGGSTWQFPDYDNADTFVDWLVRGGLLLRDPIVGAALQDQRKRPVDFHHPASFPACNRGHAEHGSSNRTRPLCHAPLTARCLDPGHNFRGWLF